MEKTLTSKDVSNNIKAERKRAGFSQAEIAIVLKMSRNNYGILENNPGKIRFETLSEMAGAFGCTVNDFFMVK